MAHSVKENCCKNYLHQINESTYSEKSYCEIFNKDSGVSLEEKTQAKDLLMLSVLMLKTNPLF